MCNAKIVRHALLDSDMFFPVKTCKKLRDFSILSSGMIINTIDWREKYVIDMKVTYFCQQ